MWTAARQGLVRALAIVLITAWAASCSSEALASSVELLEQSEGPALQVVLACPKDSGPKVSLDPHVIATREGSELPDEVGFHRSRAWAHTRWHGHGQLGEAPYLRVADAGGDGGQRSTITLGKASNGEYKIFIVKPRKAAKFPARCKISVLAGADEDSVSDGISLGEVHVSGASVSGACGDGEDSGNCDYWEAGKLQCSEDSCELRHTNRITQGNPARPLKAAESQPLVAPAPQQLGDDKSVPKKNKHVHKKKNKAHRETKRSRDKGTILKRVATAQQISQTAEAKHVEAANLHKEARAAALKDEEEVETLKSQLAASLRAHDPHKTLSLEDRILKAARDAKQARKSASEAWKTVVTTQKTMFSYKQKQLKAHTVLKLKQLNDNIRYAKKSLASAQKQADSYKKAEMKAVQKEKTLQKKLQKFREDENQALSEKSVAEIEIATGKNALSVATKQALSAQVAHREAVERQERKKAEQTRFSTRLKASRHRMAPSAPYTSDQKDMRTKLQEVTDSLSATSHTVANAIKREKLAKATMEKAKKAMTEAERKKKTAGVKASFARKHWKKARDEINSAVAARAAAMSQAMGIKDNTFKQEKKILLLEGNKNHAIAKEHTRLMEAKIAGSDIKVEQDTMGLQDTDADINRAKTQYVKMKKLMPKLIKESAYADAQSQAVSMAYAASWVRVFKMRKKAEDAAATSRNARRVAVLRAEQVKRLTKRLKELTKKEQKAAIKVGNATRENGLDVVEQIADNAEQARVDLVNFRLHKALEAGKAAQRQAKQYHQASASYKDRVKKAEVKAGEYKRALNETKAQAAMKNQELKDLVERDSNTSAKIATLSAKARNLKHSLLVHRQNLAAIKAAAKKLRRDEAQTKSMQEVDMIKAEASQAQSAAFAVHERVDGLERDIKKLHTSLGGLMDKRADYHARADLAKRGETRARARLHQAQEDKKAAAAATEAATAAKIKADDARGRLIARSTASSGSEKERLDFLAVQNDEKAVEARQAIEDGKQKLAKAEESIKRNELAAGTYLREGAILQAAEKNYRDQEDTINLRLNTLKARLEKEKKSAQKLSLKSDELHYRALKMKRHVDENLFQGHEKDAETKLKATEKRKQRLEADLKKVEGNLAKAQSVMRTELKIQHRSASTLASDDSRQKATVMAEADARWAAQEDKRRMALDVTQLQNLRKDAISQEKKVDKLKKEQKKLILKAASFKDHIQSAKDQEAALGEKTKLQKSQLAHASGNLRKAGEKGGVKIVAEQRYLAKKKKKMDGERVTHDKHLAALIAKKEKSLRQANKNAQKALKDSIVAETEARRDWMHAIKALADEKNKTAAHLQHLKTSYKKTTADYYAAAAMAVGVVRFTSQDKLDTEHNLKQLSLDKVKRIHAEAEALTTPLKRLDTLSRQADEKIDHIRGSLEAVKMSNQKAKATLTRQIKDIEVAQEMTLKQVGGDKAKIAVIKQLTAKKIEAAKEGATAFLHLGEEKRLQSTLTMAMKHSVDINTRLAHRQADLQKLADESMTEAEKNGRAMKHANKVAAALIKSSFAAAKRAEHAKDAALVKLQASKHAKTSPLTQFKNAVKAAAKDHREKQKLVKQAQEFAEKTSNALSRKSKQANGKLKKEEKIELKKEKKILADELNAVKEDAKKSIAGDKKAYNAAAFKVKEDVRKQKRSKERVWELKQDRLKTKLELREMPHRIREATVELARDKMKLDIITKSETKATGAFVGAKKIAKQYSKKSDMLVKKEVQDRSSMHAATQKAQHERLVEDTDARDVASTHNQLRSIQAQVLRDYSAKLLAGVKEKQTRILSEVAELVAKGHDHQSKAKGLCGKASAAREAAGVAAYKVNGLSTEAATRAAKLAVARYAVTSLASQAKDYAVLAEQAQAEVRAIQKRATHNAVRVRALRSTINEELYTNKTTKLDAVKKALAHSEVEAESLKSVLASKRSNAEKVQAVADQAAEKAEWMKKVVVVKRLQHLASRRWVMMAEKEEKLQEEVARESLAKCFTDSMTAALQSKEAELLKAKAANLAMGSKVKVLQEAFDQAVAARRKVQNNLQKQHAKLKAESKAFMSAKRTADQKADEAANMFKMAEGMRTAQYRAKTSKQNFKDAKQALKWEKFTALAQVEQTKAEVAMAKFQMSQRNTAKAIVIQANLLGSMAMQEFNTAKSLQDALLSQKGSQLLADQTAISIMKGERGKWIHRYQAVQKQAAEQSAIAHTDTAQGNSAATVDKGEAHIAKMSADSAKRLLVQRRQEHRRALSSTQKARFKLESAREKLFNLKKEAKASTSVKAKAKVKQQKGIVEAEGKMKAAAKWVDTCEQQSLATSREVLAAMAFYDEKQENKILKEETSRQATNKASKAHSRELATRTTVTDAAAHISQLGTFIHASQAKANDVKAGIYVELLSHKEAMAQARLSLTTLTHEKANALRYAAMKVLEVDMLASKHTATEFKNLKKREAAMRRKAKTAEKRAMKLRSAGAQSKKLFKAEEKAEMKAQLKEFKDARNKVVHSKGKITVGEVQKDEEALNADSKKLAVAKAMQKAAKKEKRHLDRQTQEAFAAATRFTLAAKAERALFPHYTSKVMRTVKAAQRSKAVLADVTAKLRLASKAYKVTKEELAATKRSKLDGTNHWKQLKACSKVRRATADASSLRTQMKKAAQAAQRAQEQSNHFRQISQSKKGLWRKAQKEAHQLQDAVREAHRKFLLVSKQANEAWQAQKVTEEARNMWSEMSRNAGETMESGILKTRLQGADKKLKGVATEAGVQHQKLEKAAADLDAKERQLRLVSRTVLLHMARSKAADAEEQTLEAQARRASETGEKLQVQLDQLTKPDPIAQQHCEEDAGSGVHLSKAWKREMLRNLVSFYLHNGKKKASYNPPPR